MTIWHPLADDEGKGQYQKWLLVSGLGKWMEGGTFYSDGEQFRRKDQEFIFGDGRFQVSMTHPSGDFK